MKFQWFDKNTKPQKPNWYYVRNLDKSIGIRYYDDSKGGSWWGIAVWAEDAFYPNNSFLEWLFIDFTKSNDLTTWAINMPYPLYSFEPLPEHLDIGKRAKVVNGLWSGWEGIIRNHYIDKDDCSGTYGQHKYAIVKNNDEQFSICVKDCVLL